MKIFATNIDESFIGSIIKKLLEQIVIENKPSCKGNSFFIVAKKNSEDRINPETRTNKNINLIKNNTNNGQILDEVKHLRHDNNSKNTIIKLFQTSQNLLPINRIKRNLSFHLENMLKTLQLLIKV